MYHSQAKNATQETPVSIRSTIALPETHENARFVSFRTVTIKNDPIIMSTDPTRSRLAKDLYDALVLKEGVC
jgi:hypothetical protein